MRSATDTTRSTLSALPRTGGRLSVGQRRTLTSTVMRPPSCGFTAATGRTRRWTSGRSPVSIRRSKMSASPATNSSGACFTITSRGLPRPQCLVTTTRQMTCRTACTSRSGPGTDASVNRQFGRVLSGDSNFPVTAFYQALLWVVGTPTFSIFNLHFYILALVPTKNSVQIEIVAFTEPQPRECLDHVIVFHETGLRWILKDYFEYYERCRTHLSLEKDAPVSRPVELPSLGQVIEIPKVGGLHHLYSRKAA